MGYIASGTLPGGIVAPVPPAPPPRSTPPADLKCDWGYAPKQVGSQWQCVASGGAGEWAKRFAASFASQVQAGGPPGLPGQQQPSYQEPTIAGIPQWLLPLLVGGGIVAYVALRKR